MRVKRNFFFSNQFLNCAFLLYLQALSCYCIVHPDGRSSVSRYQDEKGNYQFDYSVASLDGDHFHKAGTDSLGRVVGSYGMTLADGRSRLVDYVADKHGFRAHIRSNEPGIISAQSADATIEKTDEPSFLPESQKLELAALNSEDSVSENAFGERLKNTASRVIYLRPDENEEYKRGKDEDNYEYEKQEDRDEDEDFDKSVNIVSRHEPLRTGEELSVDGTTGLKQGPLNRISNFHSSTRDLPPVRLPEHEPERYTERNPRTHRGYNFPLNPSSAVQPIGTQGGPLSSRDFYSPRPTSLPPKPSTPPYGGFDFESPVFPSGFEFNKHPDNSQYSTTSPHSSFFHNSGIGDNFPNTLTPLFNYDKEGKHPSLTMSTIHGGYTGYYPYNTPLEPVDDFEYRYNQYPKQPPFSPSQEPQLHYGQRLAPGGAVTRYPSAVPEKPNLTLRAVAIPNGIQAVPVNPSTGQIHNQRGFQRYDPNLNNHSEEPSKERYFAKFSPPYRNPLPLTPQSGYSPSHYPKAVANLPQTNRHYQRPSVEARKESRLNKPSSKDLAVINRVFEHVSKQKHQSGVTPDPYRFDNRGFQPDPLPDYPFHDITKSPPHSQSNPRKYDFEDGRRHYQKPEPKDFSEERIHSRRPSIAVRLPGFDGNYRNSREYRSTSDNENKKPTEDEIISGDSNDRTHKS